MIIDRRHTEITSGHCGHVLDDIGTKSRIQSFFHIACKDILSLGESFLRVHLTGYLCMPQKVIQTQNHRFS